MQGLPLGQEKASGLGLTELLEDDAQRTVTGSRGTPRKYTPDGNWPTGFL